MVKVLGCQSGDGVRISHAALVMVEFDCKFCNEKFFLKNTQSAGSHVVHCVKNPRNSVVKGFEKKELNVENYNKDQKKCLDCDKLLEYKNRNNKFCSRSCSASYNNKTRICKKYELSEEGLKSILLRRKKSERKIKDKKCKICNNLTFRSNTYCSRSCIYIDPLHSKKLSDSIKERFRKFPEQHPSRLCNKLNESYPEKMFREYFESKGLKKEIDFETQFKIGSYYVDFYFPILNLGIEIDGEQWHDRSNPKEIERENFIKKKIDLIRFWAKSVLKKQNEEIYNIIIDLVK